MCFSAELIFDARIVPFDGRQENIECIFRTFRDFITPTGSSGGLYNYSGSVVSLSVKRSILREFFRFIGCRSGEWLV